MRNLIIGLAALTGFSAAAQAATEAPTAPAEVKVVTHGDGWTFSDAKGMSLYFFDGDDAAPGKSACLGNCAKQWPPLAAPADAKPFGPWTVITRDDNSRQWAYKGKPLYAYAIDGAPGTTFGDNENLQWHTAFQPIWKPPGIGQQVTAVGDVLADEKGLTLYTFNSDPAGKSKCNDACAEKWPPLKAPALANPHDDFSVVLRDDSTTQWAYKGKPLYRSVLDVNRGETAGEGAGEAWRAAMLEPPPAHPSWLQVRPSLAGDLYADGRGMTVYVHGPGSRAGLGNRNLNSNECDMATCWGKQWVALIAKPDDKPAGNWTIVKNEKDGTLQWAYKGRRLYNSTWDEKPSQFSGIRFGGDRAWTVLFTSGQPLQNN